MTHYIVSTLSAPVTYTFYGALSGNMKKVIKEITINGGANVANKRTLVTPSGVPTQVSADELEMLKKHPVFKKHEASGHVKIVNTGYQEEAEKAAKDMAEKDTSAPRTPKDYEKEGKKSPKTKKG